MKIRLIFVALVWPLLFLQAGPGIVGSYHKDRELLSQDQDLEKRLAAIEARLTELNAVCA